MYPITIYVTGRGRRASEIFCRLQFNSKNKIKTKKMLIVNSREGHLFDAENILLIGSVLFPYSDEMWKDHCIFGRQFSGLCTNRQMDIPFYHWNTKFHATSEQMWQRRVEEKQKWHSLNWNNRVMKHGKIFCVRCPTVHCDSFNFIDGKWMHKMYSMKWT